MNRQHFQRLAKIRLQESRLLLNNGQYSGSYYLAGYAIECALKACIAKSYQRYDFPEKKKVNDSHTHSLENLVSIANLESVLSNQASANTSFSANWAVARDWKETSRYEIKTRRDALDLYHSILQLQTAYLNGYGNIGREKGGLWSNSSVRVEETTLAHRSCFLESGLAITSMEVISC